MRIDVGTAHTVENLARVRAGDVEVDRKQAALREEGDLAPVGTERGRHVQFAAQAARLGDQVRDVSGRRRIRRHLLREPPERRMPFVRQLVGLHAEVDLDGRFGRARARRVAQQPAHHLVAPASRHVGPERLAPAVGEVLGVVEILDARQLFLQDRVPHPERRVRIERTERQVLRHALDEPERQPLCAREPAAPAALARRRDVELERVDQFMSDHVIGVGERPAERQDDAAANRFGHAAGAFADVAADRVGLLEVRVRGVENQRLTPAQIVVEHAVRGARASVPPCVRRWRPPRAPPRRSRCRSGPCAGLRM